MLTQLRVSGAPFLTAVMVTFVVDLVPLYLGIEHTAIGFMALPNALDLLGVSVAITLWLIYRPHGSWSRLHSWFFVALIAWWAVLTARLVTAGPGVYLGLLLAPVAIALIAVKRPRPADVLRATDIVAFVLIGMSAVALVLEISGWRAINGLGASTQATLMTVPCRGAWPTTSFAPITDVGPILGAFYELLGLDARWSGPFENPNLAGPIGGFLVVYGLCRPRWLKFSLVAAGSVILLIAFSRSALLATAVGVLTWFAFGQRRHLPESARRVAAVLGAAAVGALAWVFIATNVRLSGRTDFWPIYLDIWRTNPVFGVGTSGIDQAISCGYLSTAGNHAHNAWIDSLARTGVIGFIVFTALLIVALLIAVRASRAGSAISLALVAMILTDATVERLNLQTLSFMSIPFVLAILLAGSASSGTIEPHAETDVPLDSLP